VVVHNGETELRSVSSGRELNTPTSRRARRVLLPRTVDAPARGLDNKVLSRSWKAVGCAESTRTAEAVLPIDNRAAPARDKQVRHTSRLMRDTPSETYVMSPDKVARVGFEPTISSS